ncbi:MAG: AAA family ATPase [Halobacteriales archaeon]|nr:AAA family ATPase [Halobacteriales archaeon]
MIRSVELEDFMSYEHALVPLQPGLNVIIGPNGSGKSTILHAVALCLGQSHTERARKLVDLIRWGKDEARVGLVMDNKVGDKKLFPEARGETVLLQRVLRRSGDYHYLLDGKPVPKQDITDAMRRAGINPDNLLIIMHQLMVVRFAAVSPQEKLRMFEEALGFQGYRGEVVDALGRLRKASDEERTLNALLASSQETYQYWEREYQRWQQKRELEQQLARLEAEQAWAQVARRESSVQKLQERLSKAQADIAGIEVQLDGVDATRKTSEKTLSEQLRTLRALREELLKLHRDDARLTESLAWAERARKAPELASEAGQLSGEATAKLREVKAKLAERGVDLQQLEAGSDDARERSIEARIDGEVLRFKRKLLLEESERLEGELDSEKAELEELVAASLKVGPRVEPRKAGEVQAELNKVRDLLKPLAHLSDEVEKVYTQHQQSLKGIQERAEELQRNKQALRADLDLRIAKWREVLGAELERISADFQGLLDEAGAKGLARLLNSSDIERAGLEILAGFKGQEPIALETFAQSGGERSVALMAFLLALQQRIASPFRAVDEFDVHMDPHNRELITNLIVRSASQLRSQGVQYVAITPAPVFAPEGSEVIVVQNAGAGSKVGRLAVA